MDAANYSVDTLEQLRSREFGVSESSGIEQPAINAFVACTGDHQWIHVDEQRARTESPFGRNLAHGYFTMALLAQFQIAIGLVQGGAKQAINDGIDSIRFLAPLPSGARVRGRTMKDSIERPEKGAILMQTSNTFEIENFDNPASIAETLILLHQSNLVNWRRSP